MTKGKKNNCHKVCPFICQGNNEWKRLSACRLNNTSGSDWACSAMDNAPDYESGDSRFESWQARDKILFAFFWKRQPIGPLFFGQHQFMFIDNWHWQDEESTKIYSLSHFVQLSSQIQSKTHQRQFERPFVQQSYEKMEPRKWRRSSIFKSTAFDKQISRPSSRLWFLFNQSLLKQLSSWLVCKTWKR